MCGSEIGKVIKAIIGHSFSFKLNAVCHVFRWSFFHVVCEGKAIVEIRERKKCWRDHKKQILSGRDIDKHQKHEQIAKKNWIYMIVGSLTHSFPRCSLELYSKKLSQISETTLRVEHHVFNLNGLTFNKTIINDVKIMSCNDFLFN